MRHAGFSNRRQRYFTAVCRQVCGGSTDRPGCRRSAGFRPRMLHIFSCADHCFFVQYLRILDKTTVLALAAGHTWGIQDGWIDGLERNVDLDGRGRCRARRVGAGYCGAGCARRPLGRAPGALGVGWIVGRPSRRAYLALGADGVDASGSLGASAPHRTADRLAPPGCAGGRRPHGPDLGRHDSGHDVAGCSGRVLI